MAKSKWVEDDAGAGYVRKYGLIRVVVDRVWFASAEPTGYKVWIAAGNVDGPETFIPMASVGVDWFDDVCGPRACKMAERWAKTVIRGWLRG